MEKGVYIGMALLCLLFHVSETVKCLHPNLTLPSLHGIPSMPLKKKKVKIRFEFTTILNCV